MLRRLNRLVPPPDPEALALEKVRELFEFATYKEKEEVRRLSEMMDTEMTLKELAEKDPQRAERYILVLKAIFDRQASGVKPSWEERLSPRVRWRAVSFEKADQERRKKDEMTAAAPAFRSRVRQAQH